MQGKILIYGHGDKSEKGFSNVTEFRNYIGGEIFTDTYNGRYRYSQRKDADIIILTRDGFAHGFFVIAALDEPTEKDKKEYPRVRQVYMVKESALFEKAVPVGAFGITGYQFGKYLSEEQFKEITTAAGGVQKAGPKHR
jgi:hypothetical protein